MQNEKYQMRRVYKARHVNWIYNNYWNWIWNETSSLKMEYEISTTSENRMWNVKWIWKTNVNVRIIILDFLKKLPYMHDKTTVLKMTLEKFCQSNSGNMVS